MWEDTFRLVWPRFPDPGIPPPRAYSLFVFLRMKLGWNPHLSSPWLVF